MTCSTGSTCIPDFDPRQHYKLTVVDTELTDVERNARAASSPDDIELDL